MALTEKLTAIADAIREKKNTTAIFTLDQMAVEIEGIVTGDDLPNAEEGVFGKSNAVETSLTVNNLRYSSSENNKTTGYMFTPVETFAVNGFYYCLRTNAGSANVKIWDVGTKTAIFEQSVDTSTYGKWLEITLDNPINLIAGKTYMVSLFHTFNGGLYTSGVTVNSKLGTVSGYVGSGNVYPSSTVSDKIAMVNLIMGSAQTESVTTEYKIQTATMNDIAEEVQRITGAETKLNTAQIITALQGIAVQTTE